MSRVRIHIGKLVLPAHLAKDAAAIEAAVRDEICTRIGDRKPGANASHTRRIEGGTAHPGVSGIAAAIGDAVDKGTGE